MRKNLEILERMQRIESRLERLDVAIITRYPDSERAADEYGALRKAVNAAASASTLHRQNLIGLVNAIDDGANAQTVREKLCDLLSTLSTTEIRPGVVESSPREDWAAYFDEVGDEAIPRSAWIRQVDEERQVVQRGYVREFAEETASLVPPEPQPAVNVDDPDTTEGFEPSKHDQPAAVEPSLDENGEESRL